MARFQESKNHIQGGKVGTKLGNDTTSPMPKSGPSLMNPGGAGNKGNGIPTHRAPNKKLPGAFENDQNEDAGSVRKSKEFKSLMKSLGQRDAPKPMKGRGKMVGGI